MELQLRLCSDSDDDRRQKMTIFYNGHVSVADVTEWQARAILEMAKKEFQLDEKQGGENKSQEEINTAAFPAVAEAEAEAPAPATQLMNPGQSMKRSLQRFLQKRKARIADSSSPYGYPRPLLQLFSS